MMATPDASQPRAAVTGPLLRPKVYLGFSAVVTLLGFSGNVHWLLELFSHFVAWYAVVSVLLFAFFLYGRHWRWALAAFLLFAVQACAPLSWYWPTDRAPAQTNLRVLLANVLTDNDDKQSLLALIDVVDPDVICIQEANDAWVEALLPLEARYTLHTKFPRNDNFGIALYSRLPGDMQGVMHLREHGLPALAARAVVNGREVSFLGIHTLPPIGSAMAARRNAQLESARRWLESQDGLAVLAGDLNITLFSPVYRRFFDETGLQNARAGFGPLGTWPSWVPFMRLPLDHCLVSGGIKVVSCAVGPDIGSDHLPLIVDLHVPAA